ncbi:CBS domain-containing protein [Sideroxydans lithotrophicus]|uniref:CBS domain containing membrane protein n=1 Tax=Sideroxydans lithotrophicus (strain ES-1) TaxID=580332 RepID=D5CRF5_SIDLE|nr:CBS domain-containing protein [Sideroxydans lithotrophicus]ADE11541.1 CBS domain containing membrane protein [Sideroxydans lithotrophicus ES-1]
MNSTSKEDPKNNYSTNEVAEVELVDEDILDAMQHIPGYLDITTEDFRTIYHLAHRHALARLFAKFKACNLMRTGIEPLSPDMYLDEAIKAIVRSGLKSLPVVDEKGCVTGMLTETDFLRRLKVDTFLELLLDMLDDDFEFQHRCHETHVKEAMTSPAITVTKDAGFGEVITAFHQHDGRSTPIVDSDGRLLGILLRKDFIAAFNLEYLR